ncbi:hypothetical protein PUN28_009436 [Cardiocondyla obscurior]|uniref:Uncharacterized protein n=1 Tax=Cardiocondyla obscurior TaxID=286306 RepID=A0AAW2FX32_9HYME
MFFTASNKFALNVIRDILILDNKRIEETRAKREKKENKDREKERKESKCEISDVRGERGRTRVTQVKKSAQFLRMKISSIYRFRNKETFGKLAREQSPRVEIFICKQKDPETFILAHIYRILSSIL